MKHLPFHLITGQGKGVSYSSLMSVGDVVPTTGWGQAGIGLYINLSNNNIAISDRQWSFVGHHHPLILYYCYNSHADTPQQTWQWAHPRLTLPTPGGNTALLHEADGHDTLYTRRESGRYLAPGLTDGLPFLHYSQASDMWVWYHPVTGVNAFFDRLGRLREQSDLSGNRVHFTYDEHSQLVALHDSTNNYYTIERVFHADHTREERWYLKTPEARQRQLIVQYHFDRLGRLQQSIGYDRAIDQHPDYVTRYHYLSNSPGVSDNRWLRRIEQSDGSQVRFSYERLPTHHLRLKKLYLGDGSYVSYFHYPTGHQASCEIPGQCIELAWDNHQRLVRVIEHNGYDLPTQQNDVTSYRYHANGQLASITHPDNSQVLFDYEHVFGFLTKHTGPDGQVTDYYYEKGQWRPQLLSKVQHLGDDEQAVTHYVYQRCGPPGGAVERERIYLRYEISPEGRVQAIDYTPSGEISAKRHYLVSRFATATYPPTLSPYFEEMRDDWEAKQTPQQVSLSTYVRERHGLAAQTTHYTLIDDKGQGVESSDMGVEEQTFDEAGHCLLHQVKIDQKLPTGAEFATTTQAFDSLGCLLRRTDALAQTTTYHYYLANPKQAKPAQKKVIYPSGRIDMADIDANGMVTTIQAQAHTLEGKCQTRQTRQLLDQAARVALRITPDGMKHYTLYDQQNRLAFVMSTTGRLTHYHYDRVHRYRRRIDYARLFDLTKLAALPDGDWIQAFLKTDPKDRISYTFYDACQRVRYKVDAGNYLTEWRYDRLGRCTGEIAYARALSATELTSLTKGQALKRLVDNVDDRWQSTYYDKDGWIIGKIDADGWVSEYWRDGQGNITRETAYATPNRKATRSCHFDAMRPPTSTADATCYYFRNAWGKPILQVDPAGYITQFSYFPQGLVRQKICYYHAVKASWYQNTTHLPPLPTKHSEDHITDYHYDKLNRLIEEITYQGAGKRYAYNIIGKQCATHHYDTQAEKTCITGDHWRGVETKYDGWGQPVGLANPFVTQQLAKTRADTHLTPQQRQQKIDQLWQQGCQRHHYDANGLKLTSTDTLGHITRYYYDPMHRLVLTIDPRGAVTEHIYHHAFDDIISKRHYLTPIDAKVLAKLQGGWISADIYACIKPQTNDVMTHYHYDQRGLCIKKVDPESYVTTWTHNAFGDIITKTQTMQADQPALTTHYTYDRRGLTMAVTQQAGKLATHTQSQFENHAGKRTWHRDALENSHHYLYDQRNLCVAIIDAMGIKIHQRRFDAHKRLLTDTDASGAATTYQYDQHHRTCTQRPPVSDTQTVTTLNSFGQVIAKRDALGHCQTWQHAPDGQVCLQSDALGYQTSHHFNREGQCQRVIDPLGIETHYQYNQAQQLIRCLADARQRRITTCYQRDALGRPSQITDPQQVITAQQFDRRGLVIQRIQDPGDTDSHLQLTTQMHYNAKGQAIEMRQGKHKESTPYVVHFPYDALARPLGQVVDPHGLALATHKRLNAVGLTIANIDAKGQIERYFYDKRYQHRLTVAPDGAVTAWQFDINGLESRRTEYAKTIDAKQLSDHTTIEELVAMITASDQDSTTDFFYDANHRLRFQVNRCQDETHHKAQGIVTEKRYDRASRCCHLIGYATPIDASAIGTLDYPTLVACMATKASDEDRHHYYLYDAKGQIGLQIDPQGAATQQRFDGRGRLIKKTLYATLITEPASLLGQDPDNITLAVSQEDRTTYYIFDVLDKPRFIINPEGYVKHYHHNNNGQLVYRCEFKAPIVPAVDDAKRLAQLQSLIPDPKQDSITVYTFDRANRPKSIMDPYGHCDQFQHDVQGNLRVHRDRNQAQWQFDYDSAKRLVLKTTPATTITTLSADASSTVAHQQTQRQVQERYHYDRNNNLIKVIKDDQQPTARTLTLDYDCHQALTTTTLPAVAIDDPSQLASFTALPTQQTDITTHRIYNTRRLIVSEQQQNGQWQFHVYDSAKRLRYQVHSGDGSVVAYDHNAFGDIVTETHYATPLAIDFSAYTSTGLPSALIAKHLKADAKQDRITRFQRDKRGDITRVTTSPVLYYDPHDDNATCQLATPTTYYHNSAFRQRLTVTKTRFPQAKALDSFKRQWYNRLGELAAQATALQPHFPSSSQASPDAARYAIKRYHYRPFSQTTHEWATPIEQKPTLAMTLEQLAALHKPSREDRQEQKDYDLLKRLASVSKQQVTRQRPHVNPLPGFTEEVLTLSKHYQYTPVGHCHVVTDENGNQQYNYYDQRGFKVACRGVLRQGEINSKIETLAPLTYYGINAHGQRTMTAKFAKGSRLTTTDRLPQPKALDPTQDQYTYVQHDQRGLPWRHQDGEHHQQISTYTAAGQRARHFWQLTTWKTTPTGIVSTQHIDEKRWRFDGRHHPLQWQWRRDNVVIETTDLVYNSFGEAIKEGPGDGSYPLYRHFNQAGDCWSDNSIGGLKQITLHDLTGRQTVQLTSATLDLSQQAYDQLPTLLAQCDFKQLERTQYWLDASGRVRRQVLPAYTGRNPQTNIPRIGLCLQSSSQRPGLGALSVSWPALPDLHTFMIMKLMSFGSERPVMGCLVNTVDGFSGIDVSTLSSDIYRYLITYSLKDPTTGKFHGTYHSQGLLQFDSGITTDSYRLVAYVEDGARLWLTGNTQGLTAIELWQATPCCSPLAVHYHPASKRYYVDCDHVIDITGQPLASGNYTAKALRGETVDQQASLPFTLYTTTPATYPLSREINYQAQLTLYKTHGALSLWSSLPRDYRHYPVQLTCVYLDDKQHQQTHQDIIDPAVDLGHYSDHHGHTLVCNTEFKHPVEAIIHLTLTLQVTKDDQLLLYTQEKPTPATAALKSKAKASINPLPSATAADDPWQYLIASDQETFAYYHFAAHNILYIMPLPGYQHRLPTFTYRDVTQGRMAMWKQLKASFATTQGVGLEVTAMLPGCYPYRLPDHPNLTEAVWIVSHGDIIVASEPSNEGQDTLITAHRDYSYDVWGNRIGITDANGHTTYQQFNDLNKLQRINYPPVSVVDEHGVEHPQCSPVKQFGYDRLGKRIALTNENGHTTLWQRDAAGQQVACILGDGTITQRHHFNALGQKITYQDAPGNAWQQQFDRCNLLRSVTTPLGRKRTYHYDQQHRRTRCIDAGGHATRYCHDVKGNNQLQIMPLGQTTCWHYHRSGQLEQQINPDGKTLTYRRNYFGQLSVETLLDGTTLCYQYDHKNQILSKIARNSPPRQCVILYYEGFLVAIPLPHEVAVPLQAMYYTWSGGLLTKVHDRAHDTTSLYSYDNERHCVHREICLQGGSVRTMSMTLDPRGYETWVYDTTAQLFIRYDAAGNVRHRRAIHGHMIQDLWNRFDRANRIVVDAGILNTDVTPPCITIVPDQGTALTYQHNRRFSERQMLTSASRTDTVDITDVTTYFYYDKENRLTHTQGTNATRTQRRYHPVGWVAAYQEQNDCYRTVHTIACDSNERQYHDDEQCTDSHGQTTTVKSFTPQGHPQQRHIDLHHDWLYFDLTNQYDTFEKECLSKVSGTTHDRFGTRTVTPAQLFYDANRHPNAKYGSDDGSAHEDDSPAYFVYFDTTHEGHILRKRCITYRDLDPVINNYYFISPRGTYFASYQRKQDPRAKQGNIHYEGHHTVTEQGGVRTFPNSASNFQAFNALGNEETTRQFMVLDPVQALVPKPQAYTFGDYVAQFGRRDGYDEYVPAPMSNYPPAVPSHYTVSQPSESFAEIAATVVGSARYASQLAQANGWPVNHRCQQGEVITIPSLQINRKQANDHRPYQQVLATIIGPLSPHLEWKQPHHHGDSCGDSLLEIFISVVSIVVGTFTAGVGSIAIDMLEVAVIAGITDAVLQGVAVGIGLLSHFSWDMVLKTSLNAALHELLSGGVDPSRGMLAQLKMARGVGLASQLKVMRQLVAAYGAANATEQLAELATGERAQLDIREMITSMVTGALDAGLSSQLPNEGDALTHYLVEGYTDFMETLVGDAIMGARPDLLEFIDQQLASCLGVAAGKRLGLAIRHWHTTSSTHPLVSLGPLPDKDYATAMAAGQGVSSSPTYMAPPSVTAKAHARPLWLDVHGHWHWQPPWSPTPVADHGWFSQVSHRWQLGNRLSGLMETVGGLGEAALATGLEVGSEGIAAFLSASLFVQGVDTTSAGLVELWSGQPQQDFTTQALVAMNVSPSVAKAWETAFSLGAGMSFVSRSGFFSQVLKSTATTAKRLEKNLLGRFGWFQRGEKTSEETLHIIAKNRVQHEALKAELRQNMQKPIVSDPKLQRFINKLYRPNAKLGSGSTADAIRHELITGESVGGKIHLQKGQDALLKLQKWIDKNPTVTPGDRAAVENIIHDLNDAMGNVSRPRFNSNF